MIEEQVAENERLLLNILPATIAQRLKAGERIADQLQQVSVIFIHMHGFAQMSKHNAAAASPICWRNSSTIWMKRRNVLISSASKPSAKPIWRSAA
ncbi:MAG: hypothetical protein R2911_31675 [Caldilineaceae bacterium]